MDPFDVAVVNPAKQHVWMRCTEDLGPPNAKNGESFLHHSALVYASDWSLGVCACVKSR